VRNATRARGKLVLVVELIELAGLVVVRVELSRLVVVRVELARLVVAHVELTGLVRLVGIQPVVEAALGSHGGIVPLLLKLECGSVGRGG
jgi:hypothetical protein